MADLRGRVALVTGGGDGIGRAVVDRFVADGACVGVLERDPQLASSVERDHTGRVLAIVGDVRDAEAHQQATDRVLDTFGSLDTYVGNAGIYDYGVRLSGLGPAEICAGFEELFTTNVLGCLLGVQAALPALRESAGAVILTCSSSGSYAGGGGALYVASKHAVVGLVRQLAFELAPDVRVNAVAPGATCTGLSGTDALGPDRSLRNEERLLAGMAAGIPLGFVSEPRDHAGLYALLADPTESRFVTGAVMPSDGGLEVRGGPPRKRRR